MSQLTEDKEYICKRLAEYYKEEPWRVGFWLITPNYYLKDQPPAWLIVIGRANEVKDLIENNEDFGY